MNENELLAKMDERMKAFEDRMERLEKTTDNISSLTVSVERMSVILNAQVEAQKETNDRLKKIESEPRDTMLHIKSQIITVLVTGIITAIFFSV